MRFGGSNPAPGLPQEQAHAAQPFLWLIVSELLFFTPGAVSTFG